MAFSDWKYFLIFIKKAKVDQTLSFVCFFSHLVYRDCQRVEGEEEIDHFREEALNEFRDAFYTQKVVQKGQVPKFDYTKHKKRAVEHI